MQLGGMVGVTRRRSAKAGVPSLGSTIVSGSGRCQAEFPDCPASPMTQEEYEELSPTTVRRVAASVALPPVGIKRSRSLEEEDAAGRPTRSKIPRKREDPEAESVSSSDGITNTRPTVSLETGSQEATPSIEQEEYDSEDEQNTAKFLRVKTEEENKQSNVLTLNRPSRARKEGSRSVVATTAWIQEVPRWKEKVSLELDSGEVREDLQVLSGAVEYIPVCAPRYQDPLAHIFALRTIRAPSLGRTKGKPPASAPSGGQGGGSSTVAHGSRKEDLTLGQFAKHPTKKGWFSCRQCDESIWPPNARKHAATCAWTDK